MASGTQGDSDQLAPGPLATYARIVCHRDRIVFHDHYESPEQRLRCLRKLPAQRPKGPMSGRWRCSRPKKSAGAKHRRTCMIGKSCPTSEKAMHSRIDDLLDPALLARCLDADYIREQTHPTLPLRIFNYAKKAVFEREWNEVTRQCRGLVIDHRDGSSPGDEEQ